MTKIELDIFGYKGAVPYANFIHSVNIIYGRVGISVVSGKVTFQVYDDDDWPPRARERAKLSEHLEYNIIYES